MVWADVIQQCKTTDKEARAPQRRKQSDQREERTKRERSGSGAKHHRRHL